MELDCWSSPDQAQQPPTQFQKESSIQHLCNHTCSVAHEFGNVYLCRTSGLRHVCDANCSSRVYRDPYSSICLISQKLHGPLQSGHFALNNAPRKRGSSCSRDDADAAKRMNVGSAGFAGSQGCVFMEA